MSAKRIVAEKQAAAARTLQEKKEGLKDRLLDLACQPGAALIELIKESVIKQATEDPYMPRFVARALRWAIDGLFQDLKIEGKKGLRSGWLVEEKSNSDG